MSRRSRAAQFPIEGTTIGVGGVLLMAAFGAGDRQRKPALRVSVARSAIG